MSTPASTTPDHAQAPLTGTDRYRAYGTLNIIQSASALVFSTFLLTHTIQISLANLGGVDLANRYLLLGRPLYQDRVLEPVLTYGALGVHLISSAAKNALRANIKQKKLPRNDTPTTHDTPTPTITRPLLPYHTLTGQLLAVFVTTHYLTVRYLPLRHFGDSAFLDFTYVSLSLQRWPLVTCGFYTGLVGLAAYHVVSGMPLAVTRVFGRRRKTNVDVGEKKVARRERRHAAKYAVVAGMAVVLLGGLVAIGQAKKIPLRWEYLKIYAKVLPEGWVR